MKYAVTATRQSAALYFAADYGVARAVQEMSQVKHTFGALRHFRTKREANQFAGRVSLLVNWQRGRLGLTANNGGIFVIDHPYKALVEA